MHVARRTGPGFGLGWIAANAAGYGLAFSVWYTFSQPIWPALSGLLGGSLTLALYGAAVGASASLAQALVLRQRPAQASRWIAATTAGFALSFVVAAWVSLVLSRAFAPGVSKYVNNIAVGLAFGVLVGASVGVTRWLVLRSSSPATARWIPASAVAFTLGCLTVALEMLPPTPVPIMGAAFGAWIGAVTALVEWLWLGRRAEVWPGSGASLKS